MSLTTAAPLVRQAAQDDYAVPAVNTSGADYDIVRAIVEVAEERRSPVILMCYAANAAYQGFEYAGVVMRYLAERADVPVAVHLDHATDEADIQAALDAG
ncbi:MAG: class II fructose-bisphosphate aldolase, partial [Lentisphaerae bacterium]|nr:class II fructose-bisphosphate aldolase [Lentisphaerota bacterium]